MIRELLRWNGDMYCSACGWRRLYWPYCFCDVCDPEHLADGGKR